MNEVTTTPTSGVLFPNNSQEGMNLDTGYSKETALPITRRIVSFDVEPTDISKPCDIPTKPVFTCSDIVFYSAVY